MSNTKEFFETVSKTTENAKSKVLKYSAKKIKTRNLSNDFELINGKAVLFFLTAVIYLFSAIEEADWNIFSANEKNDEQIIDQSIWNIYKLIPFSKFE